MLLPGDQPTEPGAHTGHTRYRNGRLEAWNGKSWHAPRTTDVFETTEIAARHAQTGVTTITLIEIPDPDVPYRLIAQASPDMTPHQCRADLYLRATAPSLRSRPPGVRSRWAAASQPPRWPSPASWTGWPNNSASRMAASPSAATCSGLPGQAVVGGHRTPREIGFGFY
ncbi:hypothetical protein HUO13_28695 [Saccharopolyspora erythraea]|uniref:hypothetical protein n=1 Tax=Saccharopolyspora erythraea TaxID=1836 RepID=UPI001BA4A6C8|nr:hypothetical protein [Saccharopolyspora erythraea]QUH04237.1 hypothetical protein HUO13_28695 [Saccharopolyspora erythraea]